MKLPIKKKYFDQVKSGEKDVDFRDAHITFVCEETKEELTKSVSNIGLIPISYLRSKMSKEEIREMFTDKKQIYFSLK